jgi:ribonuclease Z
MKWLKRIAVVAVSVIVAAISAWLLFPRPISETLFRVGISLVPLPAEARQEGLDVYLCGTGSPLTDPTRSGPCLGIVAGGRAYVIDPGEASARRLFDMGFPIGAMEAIIITHVHSDHIDGLGNILLQAWIVGSRKEPLPVYGPQGVERVVAGVNETFGIDSTFRTAHHGEDIADPAGYGAEPRVVTFEDHPLEVSEILADENVRISATPVSHAPVHPAMGVRIDHAGRSVSFSGDTLYDERFVKLSHGVDLMIHDAMQHRMVGALEERARSAPNGAVAANILKDIVDYHASPEDAARAAQDASAQSLVLTHIVPPLPSRLLYPAFLGDAPSVFDGPITVAEDGMIFSFDPAR